MNRVRTVLACVAAILGATCVRAADPPVNFGREVLPILSNHCFACHGPDEHARKASLRLDLEDDARKPHDSGTPISAGKPGESELIARITSDDASIVMPPPDFNKPLAPRQVEILRRWIAEGAPWGRHWSFEPVVRPEVPDVTGVRHPIDAFIVNTLRQHQLEPQRPAEPQTLVRRLSLDLVGVPASLEVADRFAADPSPQAYEKLVDDLLASPQFGENWARMWLDLARYADTKGYEKDLGRTMWPYRDWVIGAFNRDMPLDQFTVEQLAGDLLPNPTNDQIVATAFHRNTMSNDEGGTDDEEFRTVAVKDRIDTTVQVWMGLTMGCAKCHTHKYDPISHAEYYSFYALFNQTEDADRYDDSPTFALLSPEWTEQRKAIEAEIASLNESLTKVEAEAATQPAADNPWVGLPTRDAVSEGGATLNPQPDGAILVSGKAPLKDVYTVTATLPPGTYRAVRLETIPARLTDGQIGLGRSPKDPNFVVSELTVERAPESGDPVVIALTNGRSDFSQDGWPVTAAIDGKAETGWAIAPKKAERHAALFDLAEPLVVEAQTTVRFKLSQQYGQGLTLLNFRLSASTRDPKTLTPLAESPAVAEARAKVNAGQEKLKQFDAATPRVPVLRELTADKHRPNRIHVRGNFLEPGESVPPALLAAFGPAPNGAALDRLAVARWIVSPTNPLTPRVWANRVWSRLFGNGLVETEEDFGALGTLPSHPELLDWLAAEYRDNGWSLKKLLKTIVMSDTYRQSSAADERLREIDPQNRLLSRGARYRLTAEVIRDQALGVSGLLSQKAGGPPVMPPQPAGLWRSTYNGQKWIDAEGEDRYRRGLYTYWKRTTPYPSMITFDAGSREVCQIRRISTNTPLQALITLNDPVYLEASAALANRMIEASAKPEGRVAHAIRLTLLRPVRADEVAALVGFEKTVQKEFERDPKQAEAYLKSGRAKPREGVLPAEQAAWMTVANAILNLDEVLTRN
jgi:hypothetical protein